uniref:GRAM domain containing 1Bb n=1 Tax=Eptatretus burgeri TaxID=7764 RepID=A0A8C4R8S2_EPTBU
MAEPAVSFEQAQTTLQQFRQVSSASGFHSTYEEDTLSITTPPSHGWSSPRNTPSCSPVLAKRSLAPSPTPPSSSTVADLQPHTVAICEGRPSTPTPSLSLPEAGVEGAVPSFLIMVEKGSDPGSEKSSTPPPAPLASPEGSGATLRLPGPSTVPRSSKGNKKSQSWYNVLSPTYKQRNEDFRKLFKQLPESERLIVDYSCALQRDILLQGRLYVSENWLCFYSNIFRWETLLCIRFKDITAMTKEKTARLIPNAVQVSTETDKHFFTSLGARDRTYMMMFRLWQNALLDKPLCPRELWQFVHQCYGNELGLTSEDEDYVPPEDDISNIGFSEDLVEDVELNDSSKAGSEGCLDHSPLLSHKSTISLTLASSGSSELPSSSCGLSRSGVGQLFFQPTLLFIVLVFLLSSVLPFSLLFLLIIAHRFNFHPFRLCRCYPIHVSGSDLLPSPLWACIPSFHHTLSLPLSSLVLSCSKLRLRHKASPHATVTKSPPSLSPPPQCDGLFNGLIDEVPRIDIGVGRSVSSPVSDDAPVLTTPSLDLNDNEDIPTELSDSSETSIEELMEVESFHEDLPGKVCINCVFGITAERLFQLLFRDPDFARATAESRKMTDLCIQPWKKESNESQKRELTYGLAAANPLAPKTANAIEIQNLHKNSREGECYVVDAEIYMQDIPYQDYFYTVNRYCILRVSKCKARLRVSSDIRYRKQPWGLVKTLIERNSWSGLVEYFHFLEMEIGRTEKMLCSTETEKVGSLRRRKRHHTLHRGPASATSPVSMPTDDDRICNLRTSTGSNTCRYLFDNHQGSLTLSAAPVSRLLLLLAIILLTLVSLNAVLFYKLWALEASTQTLQTWDMFRLGKQLPQTNSEWAQLVEQQQRLHASHLARWRDTLRTTLSQIDEMRESLSKLQQGVQILDSNTENVK